MKTPQKVYSRLETRDFISIGIFSLIYAASAFVIGGIVQMTPITSPSCRPLWHSLTEQFSCSMLQKFLNDGH